MPSLSSLFKKKSKKSKGARGGSGGPLSADHLGADHLGGDHLAMLGDSDVRKRKHIATDTANGGVDKVKYNREIGASGTKEGFFKGEGGWEDPMIPVSHERPEEGDRHMGLRAVLSSQIDQMLGTDVLTHDHFAELDGAQGTVSSQAAGEALRTNDADFNMAFSMLDGRDAAYQQSMWDLQLNDYLSGQVDRHGGNIFYDDKTGRVRGIDNDLAFGDAFNETMGQEKTGMGDNSKHIRELPHMIDARTAEAVLGLDDDAYLDLMLAEQGGQQLTPDEALQAYDRLQELKLHIQAIQAGEADGHIVEEWNEQTAQLGMDHGADEKSSYFRYNQEAAEYFESRGDNRKLTQQSGIKTFSGDKKRRKKRDKQAAKAEKRAQKEARRSQKREAKAARRAGKRQRREAKSGMSAAAAVQSGGINLMDYLDPSM